MDSGHENLKIDIDVLTGSKVLQYVDPRTDTVWSDHVALSLVNCLSSYPIQGPYNFEH